MYMTGPKSIASILFPAALAAFLGASSMASAADDNGFCADLKFLTAQVQGGFIPFRGAQLPTNSPNWNSYASTHSLGGARCTADHLANNGSHSDFLTCFFAPTPTKNATADKIANNVLDCLKIKPAEVDFDDADDTGSVQFDGPDFEITILAADSYPETHLVLTGK